MLRKTVQVFHLISVLLAFFSCGLGWSRLQGKEVSDGTSGRQAGPAPDRFLDVHLGERCHERLLKAPGNSRTARSRTVPAVLQHPQLQLADPDDERAGVWPLRWPIRAGVRSPLWAQRLSHLGLQELLQNRLDDRPRKVPILCQQRLHILERRPKFASAWCASSGDLPLPGSLTPLLRRFLQNLRTRPV
jgi:hypothetical protein